MHPSSELTIPSFVPPGSQPSTYWRGGDTGNNQVHGADTILAALHAAGAFHDPLLLVDAPDSNLLLMMRTGKQTAGHPGWTHGGFTSLLMDEMAGQAYAEFIQPTRGTGMTANLTVNYTAPLPTEADLLVMAGVERVEGRKVWLHLEVRDSPPVVCQWTGDTERDAEEEEEREQEEGKRDGAVGKKRNGGGGGGDGTVYATGSALFIVLAKD
jgi:acyl-coenzyme A thioesterase PaaI-like protein